MSAAGKRIIRMLGVLIFSVGVLLGMALSGVVVWADLEADMFDTTIRGDARLTSLKCPVMITADEIGTASATFENPLERPVEFNVRTHISQGYVTLMREINSKLPVAPGEAQTLEWTVTPEDAAYGRLILIRVRLFPKYPLRSRHASCGILVLDVPHLSGNQVFAFTLAASLLSMVAGAGSWVAANRPLRGPGREVTRAMGAVAASVLAAMVAGLLGWWMLGALIFVITMLLIGVIIGYLVNRSEKKPI